MSYSTQLEKEVRDAYVFLRTNNQSIPSETLDFMLQASIEKIVKMENYESEKQTVKFNKILIDYTHTPIEKTQTKKPTILKELKKISDVYLNKKDYISYGQINRAIDVVEDYTGESEASEEDEIKSLLMENFHISNEQFARMAEEIINLRKEKKILESDSSDKLKLLNNTNVIDLLVICYEETKLEKNKSFLDVKYGIKKYFEKGNNNEPSHFRPSQSVATLYLNENAFKKLEYIKGRGFIRDFPKEMPDSEWVGAVLDLLQETGNL